MCVRVCARSLQHNAEYIRGVCVCVCAGEYGEQCTLTVVRRYKPTRYYAHKTHQRGRQGSVEQYPYI